jgi:hypothetical protein
MANKVFLGVAVLLVVGSVLVAVARRTPAIREITDPPKAELVAPSSEPLLSPTQQERGPTRMIRFTLFRDGIFPRQLRIQAGLINLQIEDKTNSTAGLVIERINGNDRSSVGEVRRFTDHWRGRELLRFTPGHYRLYDRSQPRSTADLIVEP